MVRVKNLVKTYSNGNKALNSVSFNLKKSEITGYIGLNGAGKTTTIKILCGLLEFDSGEVELGNYRLPEDLEIIKTIVGYVPENPEIFNSINVLEFFDFIVNIRFMDENTSARRINYFAELFDFKDYLNTSIGKLSKGNKQKVMITSALMHNPDIIFLDEPLNGLDAFSIMTFQDMIANLSKNGKTIFYCSHLLDIMQKVSDRIIIIENGIIKIDEFKKNLELNYNYKSLESIFRNISGNSTHKIFSYDEVFG